VKVRLAIAVALLCCAGGVLHAAAPDPRAQLLGRYELMLRPLGTPRSIFWWRLNRNSPAR
jgi:hypothetical protein